MAIQICLANNVDFPTVPCLSNSVADPGSRIPDPDFYPSRIPDSKTATKERGEKKFDVKPFYVATKFNKIVNYFSL